VDSLAMGPPTEAFGRLPCRSSPQGIGGPVGAPATCGTRPRTVPGGPGSAAGGDGTQMLCTVGWDPVRDSSAPGHIPRFNAREPHGPHPLVGTQNPPPRLRFGDGIGLGAGFLLSPGGGG